MCNDLKKCFFKHRWFYWTDTGSDKIERASMDGTSRTALHTTGLSTPYALTVDRDTQTLYWADYSYNKLESSRTDGSNRVLLTSVSSVRDPFGITLYDGTLYWSDWYYNRLLSTPINTPNSVTFLGSYLTYDPWGIQAITEEQQREGTL